MAIDLTDEQKEVISHRGGHALVSAVAGSGKSTTLIARTVNLLKSGISPDKILIVQYNKDARKSFQKSLTKALGSGVIPEVRTFHSVGYSVLLKSLVNSGVMEKSDLNASNTVFEILAKNAITSIWKREHGNKEYPPSEVVANFIRFITLVKAHFHDPTRAPSVDHSNKKSFMAAFELFERERKQQKKWFFDDLIFDPMMAIKNDRSLWELFSNKVDHLLIDEFQDINEIQFEMIRGMAGTRANVMAVGDPDQSIYAFRGSSVEFINSAFEMAFSPCKRFTLSYTFRFGHECALAANHLITHNRKRDDKITVSHSTAPKTAVNRIAVKDFDLEELIAKLKERQQNGQLSDSVLIVRTYSQAADYEMDLALAKIPYFVDGRPPLVYVSEFAAMIALVGIATGKWLYSDERRTNLIKSLLITPSLYLSTYVVESLAKAIASHIDKGGKTPGDVLLDYSRNNSANNNNLRTRLDSRADALNYIASGAFSDREPVASLRFYVKQTDLDKQIDFQTITPEQQYDKARYVERFMQLAEQCESHDELLGKLSILQLYCVQEAPTTPYLSIISPHKSKGLQWDTVIVGALTQGAFPFAKSSDLEEERRLCYVAFTRAKRHLILVHPRDKELSEHENTLTRHYEKLAISNASQFLFEAELGIGAKLIDAIEAKRAPEKLKLRRIDIVHRYLSRQGVRSDTIVQSVTPVSIVSGATEKTISNHGRSNSSKPSVTKPIFKAGDLIKHPTHGTTRITTEMGAFVMVRINGVSRKINPMEDGWERV